jgi:hypothetical protein
VAAVVSKIWPGGERWNDEFLRMPRPRRLSEYLKRLVIHSFSNRSLDTFRTIDVSTVDMGGVCHSECMYLAESRSGACEPSGASISQLRGCLGVFK